MSDDLGAPEDRTVPAVFGRAQAQQDAPWEQEYAAHLKQTYSPEELLALYSRYRGEEGRFETEQRRVIVRAMSRRAGHALKIEPEVILKHPETMEFGNSVFIGSHAMIQGRFDGTCRIGNNVWIGPHAYLDARNLILEDYVGWGPGAKVLGSSHTAEPVGIPIIMTALTIKQVVIGFGADIGTNATVLPGVRIGAHAIIGAGAVVTEDIPEYAVAAGVPAKVLRYRT